MILGEVVSKASIQYEQVIREAVKADGYDSDDKGLDWRTGLCAANTFSRSWFLHTFTG